MPKGIRAALLLSVAILLPELINDINRIYSGEIRDENELGKAIEEERGRLGISPDVNIEARLITPAPDLKTWFEKLLAYTRWKPQDTKKFWIIFYQPTHRQVVRHEIYHVYRMIALGCPALDPFQRIREDAYAYAYALLGYRFMRPR